MATITTMKELDALFDELLPAPEPKPKPVRLCAADGRIVRDVEVQVSPADFNFPGSRGGYVRVDLDAYERQRAIAEADRARERANRRALDPFGYGHWGPRED